MTQEHPITPPEELVDQWNEAWIDAKVKHEGLVTFIATQAAHWSADQELKACCEWLLDHGYDLCSPEMRKDRRPKPLSLKEQALIALETWAEDKYGIHKGLEVGLIRRALEQLDD